VGVGNEINDDTKDFVVGVIDKLGLSSNKSCLATGLIDL